ncbi:MAG: twin-arginine translocase subunit TatC [Candidatus Sumerlaeaceae bacterium]
MRNVIDREEEEAEEGGRVLSFTEHLEELRRRIIVTLVFFAACFVGGFFVAPHVITILIAPLTHIEAPVHDEATIQLQVDADGRLRASPNFLDAISSGAQTGKQVSVQSLALKAGDKTFVFSGSTKTPSSLFFLSPIEPFSLLVKGALFVAALLAIPMAVYQLWLFVAPGLLPRERRIVRPILIGALVLFPLGASFAYAVSHVMLKLLLGFGDYIPGLQPNIVASHYLSFILTLMLGFGLVFEFPLLLLLLARLGLISSRMLAERRKYAIVVIAFVAAAVTPTPDALNMLIMMAPLIILYEVSIWAIRLIEPHSGNTSGHWPVEETP